MIKNYFKIAWRNLWRNKLYSAITIAGLSLAMAGAILLLIWIQNALSMDQFHAKASALYKIYSTTNVNGNIVTSETTPSPLVNSLAELPEIRNSTRVSSVNGLIDNGEKQLNAKGSKVDPSFLSMFSFPLVKGSAEVALNADHQIVLTETLANQLFTGSDPVGKTVSLENERFVVTGVLKDLPNNTQFNFEFLLPFKQANGTWQDANVTTYVELDPSANENAVNKKVSNIISQHSNDELHSALFIYPFSKTWLYGNFENGKPSGGGINIVRLLFAVVFLLLFIGCINFMNLSTANGERRAKEVGVRKIAGAGKRTLVLQFISESILLALIAGLIGLCIAQLLLPSFNQLTDKHLSITFNSISSWFAAAGFLLFTGFLAGSYPAFYLSSFKAINALKKSANAKFSMLTPRKVLVVIQFVVSIVMINYAYVLIKQTDFVMKREPGYAKSELVYHRMTSQLQKNFEVIKQELLNSGKVVAVNTSNAVITSGTGQTNNLQYNGNKLDESFELLTTNGDFVKTNGLQLVAGRDIDLNSFSLDTNVCIINETATKLLGNGNAVGKLLKENNTLCTVVGVVKDFVNDYPGHESRPLMVKGSNDASFVNIRLNEKASANNIGTIAQIIKKYNPGYATELTFVDADYANQFKGANVSITLVIGFTIVAIFISCLGLFGLGVFMVSTRTKEIGIRKVLGASVGNVAWLLNRDFVKLVLLAVVIASPIAWLLMKTVVQNFSYRIHIEWWILAITGVAVVVIALITVSLRSIAAAVVNPVKSLRTE